MSYRRKDRSVKIQPHDPEKRAAHMAKVEQARKGHQEVLDEIMETSVKRKMGSPVEYESKASPEAESIIAEMKFQAFGELPTSAVIEEEDRDVTPTEVLHDLVDEHGADWVIERMAERNDQ